MSQTVQQTGDAIGDLPFVGRDPDGKPTFWRVEASGDWGTDGKMGEAYAQIFVDGIRAGQRRPLLAWIVRDMVCAGPARWSGMEVGFLQYIERASARFMTLL